MFSHISEVRIQRIVKKGLIAHGCSGAENSKKSQVTYHTYLASKGRGEGEGGN